MSDAGPHSLEFRSATGELLLTIAVVGHGSPPPRKADQSHVVPRDPDKAARKSAGRENITLGPAHPPPGNGQGQASAATHTQHASQPAVGSELTDETMSDAQKRFLFRILAARGITGDKAYEHLKAFFQTETLKEVSKLDASRGIERLLQEAKGANRHGN